MARSIALGFPASLCELWFCTVRSGACALTIRSSGRLRVGRATIVRQRQPPLSSGVCERMELLESIEAAFPIAPLPPVTLHQGQLSDESIRRRISESEWLQAANQDAGQTWQTLSDAALMECSCALSHFDEASFIYHLPAFLRFAVRNVATPFLTPEQSLVGAVVFAVTQRSPYSLARYASLTSAQRAVVVSFLRFIALQSKRHGQDAQKALERYWLKPPEPLIQLSTAR